MTAPQTTSRAAGSWPVALAPPRRSWPASTGLSESVTNANYPAAAPYSHASSLWDVSAGSNGTCAPAYLCNAGKGYDGPTGLGTPDGSFAFTGGAATINPLTPGAPTAVTATAGSDQAVVSWSPPSSDGGSPVVGYVVTPIGAGVPQPAHTYLTIATTQAITGLHAGVSTTFTVAALNAVGRGAASSPTAAIIPSDPIWLYYQHLGGAGSYLSTPLGVDVAAPGGGLSQDFRGGSLYWSPLPARTPSTVQSSPNTKDSQALPRARLSHDR